VAVPETGIGYFPDVGGTWALSRSPREFGTWIGPTGATIGAADAIAAGLADAMIPSDRGTDLTDRLRDGETPEEAIAALGADSGPSWLLSHVDLIETALAHDDAGAILADVAARTDKFAVETRKALGEKSPSSLVITLHLLRAARQSDSLEACLDREHAADAMILQRDDFYEGIRAALIDKDRMPRWSPATLAEVDQATLLASIRALPSLFTEEQASHA